MPSGAAVVVAVVAEQSAFDWDRVWIVVVVVGLLDWKCVDPANATAVAVVSDLCASDFAVRSLNELHKDQRTSVAVAVG